jgi:hypothetical protein
MLRPSKQLGFRLLWAQSCQLFFSCVLLLLLPMRYNYLAT